MTLKHCLLPLALLALVSACSDDPSAPETRPWPNSELLGEWSGQLALLSMVPDSSFPFWPGYQTHPLYNRRYDFHGVEASVNFTEDQFLILLQYRSDSLYFLYQEKGSWELGDGSPALLRMDLTSVSGRLETWDWQVNWDTTGCCWLAALDLQVADPARVGLGAAILKISEIQGRLHIADLRLQRPELAF